MQKRQIILSLIVAGCSFISCNNDVDNTGKNSPIDSTNTSTAPMADSFATDTNNFTNGPDNAAPKSSAMDTTKSLNSKR